MSQREEHTVYKHPGWTRIVDGGAVSYRSPEGEVMSNRQYYAYWKSVENAGSTQTVGATALDESIDYDDSDVVDIDPGETEEAVFIPSQDKPPRQTLAKKLFPRQKRPPKVHPDPSAQGAAAQYAAARSRGFIGSDGKTQSATQPQHDNVSAFPRPEPVPNKGFRAPPGSNAKSSQQLAVGISTALTIATNAVELLTSTPGMTMQPGLAEPLAQSIANLIEPTFLNKHYGSYIAGSNDYTVIGYSIMVYAMQVNEALKLRREQIALQRQQMGQSAPRQQQTEVPRQHQQYSVPPQPEQSPAAQQPVPPSPNGSGVFLRSSMRVPPPGVNL